MEQATNSREPEKRTVFEARKDGYYVTHQIETRKFYVTSKKWKDEGKERGFRLCDLKNHKIPMQWENNGTEYWKFSYKITKPR